MTAHAACSPSSAAMWIGCPASITKTKGLLRPSSKYAREGTAAHEVAQRVLQGDPILPDKIEVEGHEYVVSRSMCRDLNAYIGHAQKLAALPGAKTLIEQRVVVGGTRSMVWGTVDCGVIEANGDIHVADLKYGKGVAVDPDSPQLKLYGLGLAGLNNWMFSKTKITLTVFQPRIAGPGVREYVTNYADLNYWRNYTIKPAIEKIAAGDTTEVAGHYCRWCVRQTECAAFAGRHQKHAAAAFDDNP